MSAAGTRDLGSAHHELGFGGDLVVDARDRLAPRQRRAPRADRHLEQQPIAGHHLQPELGVVDAAQPGAAGRRLAGVHEQDGRDLRQRLDHQDARHQRRAGKMPLEEILVDRDVLDGHDPAPGLVLGDRVDERRRIAIAEPVDGGGMLMTDTRGDCSRFDSSAVHGNQFGELENSRTELPNSQTANCELLLRRGRVEALDDLVGDVQAGCT